MWEPPPPQERSTPVPPNQKTVQTALGSFREEGPCWACWAEYEGRDLELHVDDAGGRPDQDQVTRLIGILAELPAHDAECRRELACIDEHDLDGIFFDAGCDFQLAFSWGDGEWGRTVFVKIRSGKVIDATIIID